MLWDLFSLWLDLSLYLAKYRWRRIYKQVEVLDLTLYLASLSAPSWDLWGPLGDLSTNWSSSAWKGGEEDERKTGRKWRRQIFRKKRSKEWTKEKSK